MGKILVTGFEPFGTSSMNPSAEIVRSLKGDDLVTAILPVAFGTATLKLRELIDLHKPSAVLCLGQAEGRSELTPERIAINLDDARLADNEGMIRNDVPITVGGPVAYESTLPIKDIVKAINDAGVPAVVSLSAGAFLCNHVFYVAQDYFKGTKVRSGFVHVPLMDEQAGEFPGLPTMPLDQMVKAVRTMLEVL